MKTFLIPICLAALVMAPSVHAQKLSAPKRPTPKQEAPPPEPPSTYRVPQRREVSPAYTYEQSLYGGHSPLVTSEQAQAVIDKFKAAYPKLGSPRLVIYVNRELVDEDSGLKLTSRTERTYEERRTESTNSDATASESTISKTRGENRMRVQARPVRDLTDRQTVRDIERLFGRPLRSAGASLADQRLATQMLEGRTLTGSLGTSEGEQARKDREALKKIADVAIEILISSRDVTVSEVSGDKTHTVPDIQVTAIRLDDAKILGQASSADLIGEGRAGYAGSRHGVQEITEATSLALMEDMAQGVE